MAGGMAGPAMDGATPDRRDGATWEASRYKRSYPETHRTPRSWNEQFEALVGCKNEHGNCHVPSGYSLDRGLGRFVGDIKNGNNEITDDQRARLSALDFECETFDQKRERQWKEIFTQYKQNRFTLTKIKNHKLYGWVIFQRSLKSKGKLSIGREQKLNSIGFDWHTVRYGSKSLAMTNKPSKQWLAMYQKLVDFYDKNSHVVVPQSYKNDTSLGRWVNSQRRKYEDREMSDDKIGLLNDVQFVWKCNNNDASASVQQKYWDIMFGLVKDTTKT